MHVSDQPARGNRLRITRGLRALQRAKTPHQFTRNMLAARLGLLGAWGRRRAAAVSPAGRNVQLVAGVVVAWNRAGCCPAVPLAAWLGCDGGCCTASDPTTRCLAHKGDARV
jgi:hypothetical protein